jgi:hypothetical protein
MPYNLPPNKYLQQDFVFLALVIPGPKDPKKQMNIFLHPLMEEMKEVWQGVNAYDTHLKCRFNLHPTYLRSICDYLAYDKFVGCCVHGRLNCPICIDDTDAFRLQHDKKVSFIDYHRRFLLSNHLFRNDIQSFLKDKTIRKGPPKQKFGADIIKMLNDLKESEDGMFEGYGENPNWTHKSCLWELSYAKALILPHNLDLMHQEQNIVENIMSICLDVIGFTKDNVNARKDVAALCDCPSLEAKLNARGKLRRPKAPYCLKPTERKEVLRWLKILKFLHRYAANIK